MPPKHQRRVPWFRLPGRGLIPRFQACVALTGALMAPAVAQTATNHWAFQSVRSVAVPSVARQSERVQTPVDAFILARLEKAGLELAPAADRRTWVRRAAVDLTGLPADPSVVEEFVADNSPGAMSRLVDRLLESPHYGERWGRWWLDLARYADTNGQDENKVMANAWRYRDWVIRAFNADRPFDSFIADQVAGDLLPTNGVPESVVFDRWIATGFLILGPKMLAEQDKPKLVMDMVDEQIDTLGRAFLGLTVSCARCHDHKYDPVPTRDYYALAGIFKSTRTMENLDFVSKFNERRVATREQLAAIEEHARALKAAEDRVAAARQEADAALVARLRSEFPRWVAAADSSSSTNGPDATAVQSIRALIGSAGATNALAAALRELVAEPSALPGRLDELEKVAPGTRLGPGRSGTALACDGRTFVERPHDAALEPARFTLETWVRAEEFPKDGDSRRWLVAKNANEWADGHFALFLDERTPAAYLNVTGGRGGEIALRAPDRPLKKGQWHHLAMTFDEVTLRLYVDGAPAAEQAVGRARVRGNGPLVVGRRPDGYVHFKGLLDEVRLADRALDAAEIRAHFEQPVSADNAGLVARWDFDAQTPAEKAEAVRGQLREALFGAGGLLKPPTDARAQYPAATRESLAALEKARDALKASTPPPVPLALAAAEDKPVDLPVHIRGSHLNLAKDPVPRGFIRVAYHGTPPSIPADRSGRLELARWLTGPENPLTARVIVNRIWQAHFGEGLVRTADNFGVRGEAPSHPELLDWLAGEFVRSGWSVKHIHRLILYSAVWQARSAVSGEAADAARLRDPDNRLLSHFPRQRLEAEMVRDALLAVSGRLDRTTGGSLVGWKNNEYTPGDDVSAKSLRRSVYLPIVRDRVFDVFTIFDCANPSVGTARRTPTVVSHQALFFLNSPLVKEAARSIAASLLSDPNAEDAGRVREAYRRILQREPTGPESTRARRFVAESATFLKSPDPVAAWSALCQTLLASNEFLYRD